MLKKILSFCLITYLLQAVTALSDTAIAFDVLENDKVVSTAELFVSDNKMRLQRSDGLRTYMIFDNSKEAFYAINPIKRSYTVMDKEALEKVVKTMERAQIQMFKALQNISPAQRVQMEAMMKKMMPQQEAKTDMSYEPTGKSKTVYGKKCNITEARVNGETRSVICLTSPSAIGISGEDAKTIYGFQQHIMNLAKTIPGMSEDDSYWGDPSSRQFPLQMSVIRNGVKKKVNTIREVSTESLDKKLFAVPTEYNQQDIGLGL